MRQGHLTLMFLVIYIACFMLLFLTQEKYDNVQREKQKMEQALLDAMENAGREFTVVINASEGKKKQTLESAFLESFYVSLGVFADKEEQEYLRMYLPMLVLAEEDGAYFYYMQEQQKSGGVTEFLHVWSDKILYDYQEQSTEAQKKSTVAETLEKTASKIITSHNYIASQYGISYLFFVPDFLQDTSTALEFPMLFAVFQGWPLTAAGDVVYENCIDVGVYLQEVEHYVIIGGKSLLQTVCFYHKETCSSIHMEQDFFNKKYATEEEAIRKFGALPCEKCIP